MDNRIRRFSNYYGAKFEREQRERPSHWLILPASDGWFELKQTGGFDAKLSMDECLGTDRPSGVGRGLSYMV